jgi:5-methylcytosine-specific restriction protein A
MQFCLHPGCHKRVPSGRCDEHQREREQRVRLSSTERGYDWTWRTRALAFLARHPLCGGRPHGLAPVMSQCHEQGRVTAATDVDHVRPHRGDQGLFWDEENNWQSLCGDCHKRKTQAGL